MSERATVLAFSFKSIFLGAHFAGAAEHRVLHVDLLAQRRNIDRNCTSFAKQVFTFTAS